MKVKKMIACVVVIVQVLCITTGGALYASDFTVATEKNKEESVIEKVKVNYSNHYYDDVISFIDKEKLDECNQVNKKDVQNRIKEDYDNRKVIAFWGSKETLDYEQLCAFLGKDEGVQLAFDDIEDLKGIYFCKDEYGRHVTGYYFDGTENSNNDKKENMLHKINELYANNDNVLQSDGVQELDVYDEGYNDVKTVTKEEDYGDVTYSIIGDRLAIGSQKTMWLISTAIHVTPKTLELSYTKQVDVLIQTVNSYDEEIIDFLPHAAEDDTEVSESLTVGGSAEGVGIEYSLTRSYNFRDLQCRATYANSDGESQVDWEFKYNKYDSDIATSTSTQRPEVVVTNKYGPVQLKIDIDVAFGGSLLSRKIEMPTRSFGFADLKVFSCSQL